MSETLRDTYPRMLRSVRLLLVVCTVATATACTPKPVPELIYVSAEQSGEIVVIDPAKAAIVTRIAVGKRPRGMKLSPDRKQLFVALSGSPRGGPGVDESTLPPADRSADGIGVIDLEEHKLLKTIAGGQDPEAFDVSKDGKLLFVSNEETSELSVVDIAAGKVVKKVPVGKEPEGVTLTPDGKFAYVTSEADATVSVVDTAKLTAAAKIETQQRPRAIVFMRDGKTAFVSSEASGTITMIDAVNHRVIAHMSVALTTGLPQRPMGLVLSPDEKKLFVSSGRGGAVAVVDIETRTFDKLIPDVGARPWGIGVSPDGSRLYTANGPSDDVSIIDAASGKVRTRVKVTGQPWGLVVAPAKP
jgi:PQQ-dependent catabolism-associated beta-propeller protein